MLALAIQIIGRIYMGKAYYDSALRNWSSSILYGSLLLYIFTTNLPKRKKGVNFRILTILMAVFAILFLADWAGLIS